MEEEHPYQVASVLPKLRERGWLGSLSDYYKTCHALGGVDPLSLDPPIVTKTLDRAVIRGK